MIIKCQFEFMTRFMSSSLSKQNPHGNRLKCPQRSKSEATNMRRQNKMDIKFNPYPLEKKRKQWIYLYIHEGIWLIPIYSFISIPTSYRAVVCKFSRASSHPYFLPVIPATTCSNARHQYQKTINARKQSRI